MLFSSTKDILAFLTDAVPHFQPTGRVEALSGGNLNFVWRVFGKERGLILKYAPPFIAKAPDVSLHPKRVLMEAAALRLFEKTPLHSLVSDTIRPPRLIYADKKKHAIILEDLGSLPSLDEFEGHAAGWESLGAQLGKFIGRLHTLTAGDEDIAAMLHNIDIQHTRLKVQYEQVGPLLGQLGIPGSAKLGEKSTALGEQYLTKGKCLIMGDLWPRSVLVNTSAAQARVIDWEFAHYGRPAQDVAHFLAHLWMLRHRAGSENKKKGLSQLQQAFTQYYTEEMKKAPASLFHAEEVEDAGIHFGAEILARTLGSFQGGYLYEGLAHDGPVIREAVEMAVHIMEDPGLLLKL